MFHSYNIDIISKVESMNVMFLKTLIILSVNHVLIHYTKSCFSPLLPLPFLTQIPPAQPSRLPCQSHGHWPCYFPENNMSRTQLQGAGDEGDDIAENTPAKICSRVYSLLDL